MLSAKLCLLDLLQLIAAHDTNEFFDRDLENCDHMRDLADNIHNQTTLTEKRLMNSAQQPKISPTQGELLGTRVMTTKCEQLPNAGTIRDRLRSFTRN